MSRRPSTATCEWCGLLFIVIDRRGPIPKFCSPSHRQAAYLERTIGNRIEAARAETVEQVVRAIKAEAITAPVTGPINVERAIKAARSVLNQ